MVTEIVKSPSDKREYEFIRLRNGLTALLVSDPEIKLQMEQSQTCEDESDMDTSEAEDDEEEEDEETDEDDESEEEDEVSRKKVKPEIKKAAAALCVSVGSFSDPKDAQGLAHLLEHMLFMGSTKFPDENEYDTFLAKHGGDSNAHTEFERTAFYFNVNHLYLKPALERFSQFFVAPLIKIDSLEREVQAVHSEFVEALQDDSNRCEQLMCSTADEMHPYNRFAWGNEKSLTDAMNKCGDIRLKLLKFYREHYQAQRMTLVVLGGEPVQVLKEWVSEYFQDVPEGNSKPPTFASNIRPWPTGKFYRVEAVEDHHCLNLTWTLPCLDREYLKQPDEYIAHLIGHEGGGSLLHFLKSKNWALDLCADLDDDFGRSSVGYLLTVDIELTAVGLGKVHDIIGHLYEYVRMLRENKPQEWVFEEMKAIMSLDFRFVEEDEVEDYVVDLATNMHLYPPQHIIYGDYACEVWDPKLLDDLLEYINPTNMRVNLVTKSFDRKTPGVVYEPWFDVPYTVEDIRKHLLDSWSNPLRNSAFHLPAANSFIPRDFTIRHSPEAESLPSILLQEPRLKLWHKLDQTFQRPIANVFVWITCEMDSVRSRVLTELYILLLRDALNEVFYMASLANLSSSLSVAAYSIEIKVQGYNEKLKVLVEKISELLKAFIVQDERFEAMKEHLKHIYHNADLKPLTHASSLRQEILLEPCWSSGTKLDCLSSLVVEDINNFIPRLFAEAHLEALCHGNLSKQEAKDIMEVFKSSVLTQQMPESLKPKQQILKLPANACMLYNAFVINKSQENSAVEMYFQVEQDTGADTLRHRALVQLLEQIASEPFYNQLRTEEQLGYNVDCGSRSSSGIIGFCFRIQSSKYHPEYLHKRIDAFIDRFQEVLKNMIDDEFQHHKDSLISELLEKDTCLSEETDRYWEHVLDERYLFDEPRLVALLLKDLTKKHMLTWFKEYIRVGGSKRRSLCIQVWGSKFNDEFKKNTSKKPRNKKPKNQANTTINNIRHFKEKAEFYAPFNS